MSEKVLAFDFVEEVLAHTIRLRVQDFRADAKGDSEIEKLFYVALKSRVVHGFSEYKFFIEPKDQSDLTRVLASSDETVKRLSIVLQSQVQLDGWRVDFMLHAYCWGGRKGRPEGWRKLVVECDGHDFHERTKEQAAKDRSRDRMVQAKDITVFRFTGSELWRDPMTCVEQVIDWAVEGWP